MWFFRLTEKFDDFVIEIKVVAYVPVSFSEQCARSGDEGTGCTSMCVCASCQAPFSSSYV
jgi:hypothetical protein